MRTSATLLAVCLAALLACTAAPAPAQPVRAGTESQSTLEAPPASESFTFVVMGDRTGGPRSGVKILERAVEQAGLFSPDFTMTVGDMIEGYGPAAPWLDQMREFRAIMDRLESPWYPVAGNHDVYERPHTPTGHVELYKQHFGPLYYSFEHEFALFVVLYTDESLSWTDPPRDQNMSPEQMAWLRETLSGSDAQRVFVFLHHPRWFPYYRGSNWDEVHAIFAADGRPTDAFAGHMHVYRDDGLRDNVHYRAMALTGGFPVRQATEASFHHFAVVRARPESVSIALVPIDAVKPGDLFTGEDLNQLARLHRSAFVSVDGSLAAGALGGETGEVTVRLNNPIEKTLPYTLEVRAPEGWSLSRTSADGTLQPGEQIEVPIRGTAGEPAQEPPAVEVLVAMDYPYEPGPNGEERVEPVVRTLSIPVEPVLAGGSPTPDGALVLGRRGAARVDLPRLETFTLEAWVRGGPPSGRQGLMTKTESSGYGVFWGDASADVGVPTGYVRAGGRYLVLPADEIWTWDRWTHVALTFDGRTARFFVDGKLQSEATADGPLDDNDLPLFLGADTDANGRPLSFFGGEIDEARVSGVARYTSDFTPTRDLSPDADTLALYRFERAHGVIAEDSSDSGRHAWLLNGAEAEGDRRP